jgi:tRNA G18 (ribose-2'-O)-methylase SpoU
MKKIYTYSEKKFKSFSRQKQIAIIQEMLAALEKSFTLTDFASALRKSLRDCFSFMEDSGFSFIKDFQTYDLLKFSDLVKLRDKLIKEQGMTLRDSDIVVKRYDSLQGKKVKLPLIMILDNLRSAFNVGSIIRTCECLGVSKIALCGQTPNLTNHKLLETSMGTSQFVSFDEFTTSQEAILHYKNLAYEITALELTNKSISLDDYQPAQKVALLVGNESLGVSEENLALCDKIIEIPMQGIKNSLNVSNASAIAIYQITHKWRFLNGK